MTRSWLHRIPSLRPRSRAILAGGLLASLAAPLVAQQSFPPDSVIRTLLQERVNGGVAPGIVVGLLEADGSRRVVSDGIVGPMSTTAPHGNTVFEIGSITKVFTAAILADMVARGEVRLDDPAAQYLPSGVQVPSRSGKQISLLDLATHTSGLPRLPANLRPRDHKNPYATYSVEQLYEFLARYQLPRDPGAAYTYSNLGMGLLGHVLAQHAGLDYEALVTERILEPLGMRDTRIKLTAELGQRLAAGHDADGKPTPNWDLPTLAGAGALRSTVDDLLTFAAANLDSAGPLGPTLRETHRPRTAAGDPNLRVGLAWHILTTPGGVEVVWHNGGTGGYHSFMGLDLASDRAVVVLSNSTNSTDDLGFGLLDHGSPPQEPPVATAQDEPVAPPKGTPPDSARQPPVAQPTKTAVVPPKGTPPDSARQPPVAPAEATPPDSGKEAPLVSPSPAPAADRTALDDYVGQYEVSTGFVLAVTRVGNALFVQETGKPRFPLFRESPTRYYLEAMDAEITFVRDSSGTVTGLVLRQGGRDTPAKRIR